MCIPTTRAPSWLPNRWALCGLVAAAIETILLHYHVINLG